MLNTEDQKALHYARQMKKFCQKYGYLCIVFGNVCPFYDKETDICSVGCPGTWDDNMISKERVE